MLIESAGDVRMCMDRNIESKLTEKVNRIEGKQP